MILFEAAFFMEQFISADFFFLKTINRCTFPFNFEVLLCFKTPELKSLRNLPWLFTMDEEDMDTVMSSHLVDLALALVRNGSLPYFCPQI